MRTTAHAVTTSDALLAVSIEQLSALTSLGRSFIYAEIKAGRLRLTKKGKRSVILIEDAKRWLRNEGALQ